MSYEPLQLLLTCPTNGFTLLLATCRIALAIISCRHRWRCCGVRRVGHDSASWDIDSKYLWQRRAA